MKHTKHFTGMAFILSIILLAACAGNKNMAQTPGVFDQYGKEEQLNDPFLHGLQQQNDIVLAIATENTALGKRITYQVLAMKKGKWQGYKYVNSTRPVQIRTGDITVSKTACDSVIQFLKQIEVWKIRDNAGKSNCNAVINDGSNWHLLIITPTKVTRSAFYEPQFYQEHCPDASRQLFLDATNKIKQVFDHSAPANSTDQ